MSKVLDIVNAAAGALADASVIQSVSTAAGAVLVLVPGLHVSAPAVVAALVAISGTAQAVENHFSKAKAAPAA